MSHSADAASSPIMIRPMEADDLEQVLAIDRLSFSMPWPASAYRYELFENTASLLWVAVINPPAPPSRVVGMIVIWFILDEVHIATIAVHPDYRGQGIAQLLLATALESAIQHDMRSATLEVRLSNLAAQRVYQRFRFEIVGLRVRYYRDNNEDALIMTMSPLNQEYLEWLQRQAWKNPSATNFQESEDETRSSAP